MLASDRNSNHTQRNVWTQKCVGYKKNTGVENYLKLAAVNRSQISALLIEDHSGSKFFIHICTFNLITIRV